MIVLAITGLLLGAVVTERQIASQRLRDQHGALNRALRLRSAGETVAAIAHQINQPLTAISTYSELASAALAKGDVAASKAHLAKISSECDRSAEVLKSVRDLVRHAPAQHQPVQIHALIEEIRELTSSEAAAAQVEVANAVPRDFPTLPGDPIQLQQAIYNLVSNSIEAIQASGRKGRVQVVRAPERYAGGADRRVR